MLSAIDGLGIQYVGIFATDVRDKLFLAREVRQNRPDVNLFTLRSRRRCLAGAGRLATVG